jgi:membrane protease YdiL (CAAX protease family)
MLSLFQYFTCMALCAFGSTLLSQLVVGPRHPDLQWLLKCLLVMVSVSFVTARFLRNAGQRWSDYGVSPRPDVIRKVIAGLSSGCALALVWVGVVWCLAPFQWEHNDELAAWPFIGSVIATFAIGIAEEVGYRTFGTIQALRLSGVSGALLIPTAIFISAHVAGGMPWMAALLVVGSCSALYGILLLITRSLPLVAAFHVGNNLVQDAVLRTSRTSIAKLLYADPARAQQHSLQIWFGIAIVNLVLFAVLFALRKRITRKPQLAWNLN